MGELPKNSDFESSKEDVDLSQEIISLRKELEKAQIEIASVKSLANERISYLSWEIEITKQVVLAILSGVNPEVQNQALISDFQDKMKNKVVGIMRA